MRESELHQLIHSIAAAPGTVLGGPGSVARLLVGPGDDCAVIGIDGRTLLITTDQVVEGRHFAGPCLDLGPAAREDEWSKVLNELSPSDGPARGTPLELVARKAMARSISDIAAMGGTPMFAVATALLPAGFALDCELTLALHRWAMRFGCRLIGGDIARHADLPAQPLTLSTTLVGHCERPPLLRSGARPGDGVYVTGSIGASYESGWHLLFEPRTEAGLALARHGGVTSCIDISDGLGRDAARIGRASGARLVLEGARLPLNHRRASDALRACSDGEDHELLFTASNVDGLELPCPWTRIGVVEPASAEQPAGCTLIDAYGRHHDAAELGWDH